MEMLAPGLRGPMLEQQFTGRQASYAIAYPHAEHTIVLADEVPVGIQIVDRSAERIHLVDIALAPAARGAGIGTALLRRLLTEADRVGLPVHLSVDPTNAGAIGLYRRLGFSTTRQDSAEILMERGPAEPVAGTS